MFKFNAQIEPLETCQLHINIKYLFLYYKLKQMLYIEHIILFMIYNIITENTSSSVTQDLFLGSLTICMKKINDLLNHRNWS